VIKKMVKVGCLRKFQAIFSKETTWMVSATAEVRCTIINSRKSMMVIGQAIGDKVLA